MKMRIFIVVLSVCLVLNVPAWARSGTIKADYVGCLSESALDEFIGAAIEKDYRQMQALMEALLCFNLKGREYSTVDIGFATSKIRVYAGSDSVVLYVPTEAIRK